MTAALPDPDAPHPIPAHPRVAFLRPFAQGRANVAVGAWTYADDPAGHADWFDRCVLYHFDFIGDRLVIGRFCAIAEGARFAMGGGAHAMGGFSTYPFEIFGLPVGDAPSGPPPADTVVGDDVWIGREAMILPGARIGSGAVIGAGAVVAGEIRPYAVVAGNPARELRRRFDDATVAALLDLAWWDWPPARIAAAAPAIRSADLDALRRLAP
ncbi:MAG: CatB-related O-acetyltransferase [Rubrimonas sp.]|uniref:CatB-related O-acetyltransferase n=1 Tax=Rubrimonas sp. TaxID=2036015 RepID=UPI002FDD0BD1